MEYITSNKGGRKLGFENNIYIKQKALSNGTVWGDFVEGDFVRGILSGGVCPGGFCPRTISYPNSHCLNYRLVPKISEQWVDGAKVSRISDKQFSRLFQGFPS